MKYYIKITKRNCFIEDISDTSMHTTHEKLTLFFRNEIERVIEHLKLRGYEEIDLFDEYGDFVENIFFGEKKAKEYEPEPIIEILEPELVGYVMPMQQATTTDAVIVEKEEKWLKKAASKFKKIVFKK